MVGFGVDVVRMGEGVLLGECKSELEVVNVFIGCMSGRLTSIDAVQASAVV